jgi:Icc-related predicted phosphoesterase
MRLGLMSDLHNHQPKIEKCDICIIAGDLTGKGSFFEVRDFFNYAEDILLSKAGELVIIAGNHDFWLEKTKWKPANDRIHVLYNESVEIAGYKIWGCPYSLRFHDWAFNASEEELNAMMDKCPSDTNIIISHGPPRNILDSSRDKNGLGSVSLKFLCDRVKPELCVFGHIHQSAGQITIDNTLYVNAAILDDSYQPHSVNPTYMNI